MTLKELVTKYKINLSTLASATGMLQGSFHEKLYNTRGNKFSPAQKEAIKSYLKELSKAINNLDTD
ncbi:MAG: hypothetical protein V4547_17265 [Bacteroidota bacterium]